MPVLDLLELPAATAPMTPLVGLDLGEKTIGVAVSDGTRTVASPLQLIRRTKFTDDANALFKLMEGRGAGGIVIGLPVNMDGSAGPRVQATRAFVRSMSEKTDIPFVYWDERLSTVAAERTLIEMDVSRKKRAERIDSAAASFILQGALDRLSLIARSASPDEA